MAVNREQRWFRFRAEGRREAMDRFLVTFPTEAHLVSRRDDRVVVELVAPRRLLEAARSHDLSVSGAVDLTPAVRALLEGAATGNRFANGAVPRGLGAGLGHQTVATTTTWTRSRRHATTSPQPTRRRLADAVPLEPSWEGQPIHYLRIGADRTAGRPALVFIGGLHGNEWGGTEILINLAADPPPGVPRSIRLAVWAEALPCCQCSGVARNGRCGHPAVGQPRRPTLQPGSPTEHNGGVLAKEPPPAAQWTSGRRSQSQLRLPVQHRPGVRTRRAAVGFD